MHLRLFNTKILMLSALIFSICCISMRSDATTVHGFRQTAAQLSLPILMNQAQISQELKSDPVFVKQVEQFDTTALSGTTRATSDLKAVLAAFGVQRPSQLSAGLMYVVDKKHGTKFTYVPSARRSTNHIIPESYLNSIVWDIWADGIIGNYFNAHAMTRANCTLDWWGIIPLRWCYTASLGDLFNGGIAFVPFFAQNLGWLTAQVRADPSVIQTGPGLYKMIAYADWSSTDDTVIGVGYLVWPE